MGPDARLRRPVVRRGEVGVGVAVVLPRQRERPPVQIGRVLEVERAAFLARLADGGLVAVGVVELDPGGDGEALAGVDPGLAGGTVEGGPAVERGGLVTRAVVVGSAGERVGVERVGAGTVQVAGGAQAPPEGVDRGIGDRLGALVPGHARVGATGVGGLAPPDVDLAVRVLAPQGGGAVAGEIAVGAQDRPSVDRHLAKVEGAGYPGKRRYGPRLVVGVDDGTAGLVCGRHGAGAEDVPVQGPLLAVRAILQVAGPESRVALLGPVAGRDELLVPPSGGRQQDRLAEDVPVGGGVEPERGIGAVVRALDGEQTALVLEPQFVVQVGVDRVAEGREAKGVRPVRCVVAGQGAPGAVLGRGDDALRLVERGLRVDAPVVPGVSGVAVEAEVLVARGVCDHVVDVVATGERAPVRELGGEPAVAGRGVRGLGHEADGRALRERVAGDGVGAEVTGPVGGHDVRSAVPGHIAEHGGRTVGVPRDVERVLRHRGDVAGVVHHLDVADVGSPPAGKDVDTVLRHVTAALPGGVAELRVPGEPGADDTGRGAAVGCGVDGGERNDAPLAGTLLGHLAIAGRGEPVRELGLGKRVVDALDAEGGRCQVDTEPAGGSRAGRVDQLIGRVRAPAVDMAVLDHVAADVECRVAAVDHLTGESAVHVGCIRKAVVPDVRPGIEGRLHGTVDRRVEGHRAVEVASGAQPAQRRSVAALVVRPWHGGGGRRRDVRVGRSLGRAVVVDLDHGAVVQPLERHAVGLVAGTEPERDGVVGRRVVLEDRGDVVVEPDVVAALGVTGAGHLGLAHTGADDAGFVRPDRRSVDRTGLIEIHQVRRRARVVRGLVLPHRHGGLRDHGPGVAAGVELVERALDALGAVEALVADTRAGVLVTGCRGLSVAGGVEGLLCPRPRIALPSVVDPSRVDEPGALAVLQDRPVGGQLDCATRHKGRHAGHLGAWCGSVGVADGGRGRWLLHSGGSGRVGRLAGRSRLGGLGRGGRGRPGCGRAAGAVPHLRYRGVPADDAVLARGREVACLVGRDGDVLGRGAEADLGELRVPGSLSGLDDQDGVEAAELVRRDLEIDAGGDLGVHQAVTVLVENGLGEWERRIDGECLAVRTGQRAERTDAPSGQVHT